MKIKKINKELVVKSPNIILRVDFNVPMKSGKIEDDFKITRALPTIDFLLENRCKIIVLTHLDATEKKHATTKPLAEYLEKKYKKEVLFINKLIGQDVKDKIMESQSKIVILENLRSHTGEVANDRAFALELSKLGDIYINEAFGVDHRRHASLSAIKEFIPSYAGLLLTDEIINLNKILKPKQPLIAILGGAKISTKLPLIQKLSNKAKYILVGGGIANNFFASLGYDIGLSLVEKHLINETRSLYSDKIILPIDVITAKNSKSKSVNISTPDGVKKGNAIFDIGPKSISLFSSYIKNASTIIWNGPLGFFENEKFKHGTISIGRSIAARSNGKAFAVIGGGETVQAAKSTEMMDYIDWVSTGGGAMLSYLSGEDMPGLEGLVTYK